MNKLFTYEYYIHYGGGQGIVIAESKDAAITMIKAKPYDPEHISGLVVTEIDIAQVQLIDMSYAE